MTRSTQVWSLENSAFCSYLLCASLLVIKMLVVPLLTVIQRQKNKVYLNDEDAKHGQGEVATNVEAVERTRRAHLNDLENIPIFLVISLAYLWTRSPLWLTHLLFYLFVIVRIAHTVIYTTIIVRQPVRGILWMSGYLITFYMSLHTAIYALIKLF